jgi:hypothetical protein
MQAGRGDFIKNVFLGNGSNGAYLFDDCCFCQMGFGPLVGGRFSEKSWLIACILATGVMLNGIAFVPFAAIQASGDARTTAILHVLELIIYIPALFFLMNFLVLLVLLLHGVCEWG